MDSVLTDIQKRNFITVVRLGCSRGTAGKYVAVSPAEVRAALQSDPAFGQQVAQAEAAAEVQFMGRVHKAAENERNWRTSVWWLEHRAREEASTASATTGELIAAVRAALEKFAEIIVAELPSLERRQAIIDQLLTIAEEATSDGINPLESAVAAALPAPIALEVEGGDQ
jgi:hypothetical protein